MSDSHNSRVNNNRKTAASRRGFLKAGAAPLAAAAIGAGPAAEMLSGQAALPPDPVLHLTNGAIHTMDAGGSVTGTTTGTLANSITIRNGRIIAINAPTPTGPGVRVIDLGGRTVLPGLIEPHVHIVSLANRPGYHTILENTTSIRDIQQTLAERRKNVPEGQWITSMGGFHPNQWAEHRQPTLEELDEAVPDRPVLIYERFTGPCSTNSLGKAYFDSIDAGPKPHPAYKPVNVADNGSIAPAGFVGGGPSASALYLLRTMQTFEDKKRSTRDCMRYSAELGLTAHLDQVLFPTPGPLNPGQILSNLDQYTMYDSWLALHADGETIVRLEMNFLSNQADPALPELKERLRNQFQFFGDDMMRTGSIGEWAAPLNSGAVWQEAQRLVAEAQWRNENSVHDIAGLTQVVDAWEPLDKQYGIEGLRWCVHHCDVVTPELLTRLDAMGCGVQMAAFNWVTSNDPNKVAGAPFRTIVDHPIKAAIHGDGVHIAPLNPWSHIQYAITGLNSFGQQVNPGQHLTREEAIRTFTRENSWYLRMEDRIGSLELGKLADLVVLDRDYFTIPESQIRDIRSVLTIVDGDIVHDAGVL